MSDTAQIQLLCDPELLGTIPEPQPAIRFAPDWFNKCGAQWGCPMRTACLH